MRARLGLLREEGGHRGMTALFCKLLRREALFVLDSVAPGSFAHEVLGHRELPARRSLVQRRIAAVAVWQVKGGACIHQQGGNLIAPIESSVPQGSEGITTIVVAGSIWAALSPEVCLYGPLVISSDRIV